MKANTVSDCAESSAGRKRIWSTEESDWTDRLSASAALPAGLSRSSGGVRRGRAYPSLHDAASSEELGRGDGKAVLERCLQDSAASSTRLSWSSAGAGRGRTAPSSDDAASSEGRGPGDSGAGLEENWLHAGDEAPLAGLSGGNRGAGGYNIAHTRMPQIHRTG